MKRRYYLVIGILAAIALAAAALITVNRAQAAVAVPSTTLGIWNGSPGSVPDNQKPDVLNDYLFFGTPFPASFASAAEARGATPFVELEPWHGGGTSDCSSLAGSASYYQGIGSAISAGGKPVILTWGHEFNVSGQYPWAVGNGCGFTTAQWVSAWKNVVSEVRSTAGGLAYFMWAPGADTCPGQSCTTHDPSPWWPGAAFADMTGVDGYPAFCDCGTFAKLFAATFADIRKLPGFSTIPQTRIYVAETDLAPLGGSGFESIPGFISDLCSAGGDGVLQFQDGTPAMTAGQWTTLNSALAADCASGSPPVPATTPATAPAATATATAPVTTPATVPPAPACATGVPSAAPDGFSADVRGSHVVLSWGTVSGAAAYQVTVDRPDGSQWREDVVFTSSAAYAVVPVRGTYAYRVRALNSAGNGPWAALQHFTVTR